MRAESRDRIWNGARIALDLLVAGLAIWQMVTLFWVWSQRIGYPYDLEWMEGATLISALRVTQGLPLYGVPDATYIPFIYPPLYAYVVAGLSTVLPTVLPFGYALARGVSIVGTLSAAAALIFGAREAGARWSVALGCAAIFLGTWEETGTFFDLVRIDGLSIGLIGWALVLAAGRTPARAIAGGALLAVAFMCKHHAAIFGFPILAALWYRDGRAQALRFALAALIPAVVFLVGMQIATDGRFWLWLVQVPSNHGLVAKRFWPWVSVTSLWPLKYTPSGATLEVIGATPIVWGMAGVGLVSALRNREALKASPRFAYWIGIAGTGLFVVSLMRGHVGGYVNVLMPMMWVQALWPALLTRRAGEGVVGLGLQALVAVQIVTGHGKYTYEVPTPADRAQGDALIAELRDLPGPLLIPEAPYYAVLAGHDPSFSLITLWDISDASVPKAAGVSTIRGLIAQRHWKSAVFTENKVEPSIGRAYKKKRALKHKGATTRTGWTVRLRSVWLPIPEASSEASPEASPGLPEPLK
jgi:hypothetical protein